MTEDLDAAAALDSPHLDPLAYLAHLRDRHRQTRFHDVGYPVARDIDFAPVEALAVEGMWNNIGDPRTDPPGGNHTKSAERALLAWAGRLFGFPDSDRWGYVTTGGTEANFAGLRAARDSFPLDAHHATTAVAYYSAAAHYSIPKCLQELAVPAVRVRAHPDGEMDYRDLARRVSEHPGRPAVVVLTIGTTMTEAVDDPEAVSAVLDEQDVPGRYLHLDAALTGIPYALDGHLPLGLADSVGFSGYKFLGTPRICGLVLGRRRTMLVDQDIDYTATIDSTFTGSRDGLAALQMWYAVARYGNDGHRKRAAAARNLAGYLVDELNAIGCPAWRHPWAMTVVLPTVAAPGWKLAHAPAAGISHLITMPGITVEQVEAFVATVAATYRRRPDRTIPGPRQPQRPAAVTDVLAASTRDVSAPAARGRRPA